MVRLPVATVAHIIEMRFFFFVAFLGLFSFLLQVAMATHFTPATLSLFPPQSLREAAEGLRGQHVLKCHILAGDYSRKRAQRHLQFMKIQSAQSIHQSTHSHWFPCASQAASSGHHLSAVRAWMGQVFCSRVKARGACWHALLSRPHSAQWADGVVNHTLETINEHAHGSRSTDD